MKTTTFKGADWVLESVKEWVDEDPDMSEDELVEELYNNEMNYNNADKTSGQTCFQRHELQSEIETALDWLRQDSDRCSGCGKLITDEEHISECESRGEYWGVPCQECVVIGYECSNCGEQENY